MLETGTFHVLELSARNLRRTWLTCQRVYVQVVEMEPRHVAGPHTAWPNL